MRKSKMQAMESHWLTLHGRLICVKCTPGALYYESSADRHVFSKSTLSLGELAFCLFVRPYPSTQLEEKVIKQKLNNGDDG